MTYHLPWLGLHLLSCLLAVLLPAGSDWALLTHAPFEDMV